MFTRLGGTSSSSSSSSVRGGKRGLVSRLTRQDILSYLTLPGKIPIVLPSMKSLKQLLFRRESEERGNKGRRGMDVNNKSGGVRSRKGSKGREASSGANSVERAGELRGGQRLTRQLSSSQDSLLPRRERRSQPLLTERVPLPRMSAKESFRYSRWSSEDQLNNLRDSRLSLHSSPEDSDYEGSDPEPEPEPAARRIPSLRQRSNSIVLEEVEKEEKLKILSVFGMSKSMQKWKNHLWGRFVLVRFPSSLAFGSGLGNLTRFVPV